MSRVVGREEQAALPTVDSRRMYVQGGEFGLSLYSYILDDEECDIYTLEGER